MSWDESRHDFSLSLILFVSLSLLCPNKDIYRYWFSTLFLPQTCAILCAVKNWGWLWRRRPQGSSSLSWCGEVTPFFPLTHPWWRAPPSGWCTLYAAPSSPSSPSCSVRPQCIHVKFILHWNTYFEKQVILTPVSLQVWWCRVWPGCATAPWGPSIRVKRCTERWRCTGTMSTNRWPSSSSSSCSSLSWRPTSARTWSSWFHCSPSYLFSAGMWTRCHAVQCLGSKPKADEGIDDSGLMWMSSYQIEGEEVKNCKKYEICKGRAKANKTVT